MKNENVKKINTIGKVGYIILIITKIILIASAVAVVAVGILMLFMPDDFVTINGNADAEIVVNTGDLPSFIGDNVVKIEESDVKFNNFSIDVDFLIKENKISDNKRSYDIEASVEELDGRVIAIASSVACFVGAIMLVLWTIVVSFGIKLAKALRDCDSPFEQNVILRMKRFGIALLPLGIGTIFLHGALSLTTILLILVVLLFVFIFNYGAQLQQESDETL